MFVRVAAMKRVLLVFLVMCAFATAMVPRYRRAVNTEEEEELLRSRSTTETTTDKASKNVCEDKTPCAWSIYEQGYIKMNLTNTFCECRPGTVCQISEDDSQARAFVQKCRPPPADMTEQS